MALAFALHPLAFALHALAAVIWVGGMFFAYMVLRPVAASLLEPPVRLTLWAQVFGRFFPWVWVSVGVLLVSGLWMVFAVLGGMGAVRWNIHLMLALGLVMMLIYAHVYFAPFRRLKLAVAAGNWADGGVRLGQIRKLIATNLVLGLVVVTVATVGRYW